MLRLPPMESQQLLPENMTDVRLTLRPESALVPQGKSYKQASMEKRAANLRRLAKSSNPLKTLSDLEKQNSDKLFTSQEELNAVIQELLVKNAASRGNNTKTGERYMRNVVNKLRELRDANRLYKKGGVVKALTGRRILEENPLPSVKPPSNLPTTIEPPKTDIIKPPVSGTNTDSAAGGFYRNSNGIGQYLSPIMSGVRYFSQLHGRNKYYDKIIEGMNEGRVSQDYITMPTIPTYSTAYQHYENALQQQRMNGLKPVGANLNSYYAAKLMQDSQFNKSFADLNAQKSQFEQSANLQNQQIKSQEMLQNNQIAYQNRSNEAKINAGIKSLQAAQEAENQASRDNALLEIQKNMQADQAAIMQQSIAEHQRQNAAAYQKELERLFPNELAS